MRSLHLAALAGSVCALIFACSSSSNDSGGAAGGDDASTPMPPPCTGPADCNGGVCQAGGCRPASCGDATKDGDETDVDCGGSCAPCADTKACAVAKDCTSGVCTGGVCQAPNDHDGVKNGDETGVDCGGTATNKCPAGQGCNADVDCDKVKCNTMTHVCMSATHSDGIQNDGESDVDCGGTTGAMPCDVGQGCNVDGDCNAVRCDTAATLKCLPPTHTDGLKNGDETGVDCGGPTAMNKCGQGEGCASNADCNALKCDVGGTNVCLPASHTDGIVNDGETGVDCGGAAL
ncbi:MAG TPA: hypothetical protein VIF62_14200, partial [Labilithrix sp.]